MGTIRMFFAVALLDGGIENECSSQTWLTGRCWMSTNNGPVGIPRKTRGVGLRRSFLRVKRPPTKMLRRNQPTARQRFCGQI